MRRFYLTIFTLLVNINAIQAVTVSYTVTDKCFEDNLISFAHAKWLSYMLNAQLLYVPFPGSEQLKLSQDPSLLKQELLQYSQKIVLNQEKDFLGILKQYMQGALDPQTLIELPYYPENRSEHQRLNSSSAYMQINWNDPTFHQQLAELISPLASMEKMEHPQGRFTVAIHDSEQTFFAATDLERFYKSALKELHQALNYSPLHVVIFTKNPNIQTQLNRSSKSSNSNITFSIAAPVSSPFEEFFALGQFDCLIHNDAHLSLIASKVFSYKALIYPYHYTKLKDQNKIDRVMFEMNPIVDVAKSIKTIFKK